MENIAKTSCVFLGTLFLTMNIVLPLLQTILTVRGRPARNANKKNGLAFNLTIWEPKKCERSASISEDLVSLYDPIHIITMYAI